MERQQTLAYPDAVAFTQSHGGGGGGDDGSGSTRHTKLPQIPNTIA